MTVRPVVDYNRCEGKAVCAHVCPWKVFDVRTLTAEERGPLSLGGKLRSLLHGGRQAWVARPDVAREQSPGDPAKIDAEILDP